MTTYDYFQTQKAQSLADCSAFFDEQTGKKSILFKDLKNINLKAPVLMIKLNDDDMLQSKLNISVIEYDEEDTLAISQNCHDLSISLEGTVK